MATVVLSLVSTEPDVKEYPCVSSLVSCRARPERLILPTCTVSSNNRVRMPESRSNSWNETSCGLVLSGMNTSTICELFLGSSSPGTSLVSVKVPLGKLRKQLVDAVQILSRCNSFWLSLLSVTLTSAGFNPGTVTLSSCRNWPSPETLSCRIMLRRSSEVDSMLSLKWKMISPVFTSKSNVCSSGVVLSATKMFTERASVMGIALNGFSAPSCIKLLVAESRVVFTDTATLVSDFRALRSSSESVKVITSTWC